MARGEIPCDVDRVDVQSLPVEPDFLTHVDQAVRELGRVDGLDSNETMEARAAARHSLGKALAAVVRDPEYGRPGTPVRTIVDGLTQLVEVRIDLNRLVRFRNEVRSLHHSLAHRVADATVDTCVAQEGTPDRRADFHRVVDTSPTTAIGLLGTTLAGGPAAAMSAAVMAGALSVARTGMGPQLDAAAILTILDSSLKEALIDPVPVSMLAWQYDQKRKRLKVASAGHRPLWHVRDGAFESIRTRSQDPLGINTHQVQQVTIEALPGDLLVGFTTGTLEQDDSRGRSLREQDLRLALLEALPTAADAVAALHARLHAHVPEEDWESSATLAVSQLR